MQFLEVERLMFVLPLHILRLLELLESQCTGLVFGQGQACKRVVDKSACWIMSGAFKGLQGTTLAEEQTFQTSPPLARGLQWWKCGLYRHHSSEQQFRCQRVSFLRKRQESTRLRSQCVCFNACPWRCY